MKNPFGALKGKLERMAMGKITSVLLVKAAEGDFGPQVKAAYWFLRGKKFWIAVLFALATGALIGADRSGACAAVGWAWCGMWGERLTAAGALVSLYFSQVDGALHTEAPEPQP